MEHLNHLRNAYEITLIADNLGEARNMIMELETEKWNWAGHGWNMAYEDTEMKIKSG